MYIYIYVEYNYIYIYIFIIIINYTLYIFHIIYSFKIEYYSCLSKVNSIILVLLTSFHLIHV